MNIQNINDEMYRFSREKKIVPVIFCYPYGFLLFKFQDTSAEFELSHGDYILIRLKSHDGCNILLAH